jgi:hypothetical protein
MGATISSVPAARLNLVGVARGREGAARMSASGAPLEARRDAPAELRAG